MIGLFDSGVGGLGVLRHVRAELPVADMVYVADRARAPYGSRPESEIRRFSDQITQHLIEQGARMVVVACNTASGAALMHLRSEFPAIPFVGMEPAVKPAAHLSLTGIIGVLATPSTGVGSALASVVDRFAGDVGVVVETCEEWVELVEAGKLTGAETELAVRRHVEPLIEAGADVLVLGCTHYPFLTETIQAVAGPAVLLIDPAEAVARQVRRVANEVGADRGSGKIRVEAHGRSSDLAAFAADRLGLDVVVEAITFEQP